MPRFDEVKWEAESQVKTAFMETPAAKKAVRETVKAIKRQKAETKKLLVQRPKKKR